jgi:hypothetical protein
LCREAVDECDRREVCNGTSADCPWDRKQPDTTPCGSAGFPGVCCSGVCRSPGECCADTDCDAYCTGIARPCSLFFDPLVCETQAGCHGGAVIECQGLHLPCHTYGDRTTCETNLDCSWYQEICDAYSCVTPL